MTQLQQVPWTIARWSLWTLAVRVRVFVLAVGAVAVTTVAVGVYLDPPMVDDLLVAAVLVAAGVLHTEVATGIERIRRRVAERSYFDLSSVWTFAAAVLLPRAAIALVVVMLYGHLWFRVWRPAKVPLHRHLFTTATVLLAATAARLVTVAIGGVGAWSDGIAGLGAITLAIAVYAMVNTALVAAVIALNEPRSRPTELFGHWDDNMLEIATLCLGALTAVALGTNPWLVLTVLPPLLVLHRAVLVRRLEEVASTDAKTGLLNAAAWRTHALWQIERARTAVGVLILDLDHFKAVNDAYGHLVGDSVLAAVAGTVRSQVRENDLVGRFGGEEFVVLLPGLPANRAGRAELEAVAERIRLRIAELSISATAHGSSFVIDGLTVSVGGAMHPTDGASLDQVLEAADKALYEAKRAGRNQVRIAGATRLTVSPQVPAQAAVEPPLRWPEAFGGRP